MYDAASSILQQKLSQIEGVGQVTVGGGALLPVRVEVNPVALENLGLAMADVRTALAAANANRPKGEIADDRHAWSLGATDQLFKAAEYKPLIVAYANGAPVRLGDVAKVSDSVEDIRASGLADGKPAVSLIVSASPAPTSSPPWTACAPCCRRCRRRSPRACRSRSCSTARRPSARRCTTSSGRCCFPSAS